MLIDSERLKQAVLTIMPERSEVLLIVDNQPDAVVRCKDCKYRRKDGFCCFFGVTNPDFYCKCGTRKDGDGK